jgi:hypothetical protein
MIRLGQKGKFRLGAQSLKIDAEGVFFKSGHHEGITRWGGIREIVETDQYVFLLVDTISGYIVPLRAFLSPPFATDFVRRANSYWKTALSPT